MSKREKLRAEIAMAICMVGCGIAAHRSDYFGEADADRAAILAFLDAAAGDDGVEKVARAICETMMETGRTDWGGPVPAPDYYGAARAALSALKGEVKP